MQKQCTFCGEIFYKTLTTSKKEWLTKKFCSRVCRFANLKKFGMAEETKQKLSLILTGREGNSGSFKKGSVPWTKGKKLPQISGPNNHNWKEHISKPCEICKKEMNLAPWESKRRFCNRDCWALGTRGKGSPVFKGEDAKNKLRNRIMELPEYKYWRVAVFIRDEHKCTSCGSKKKKELEIDHIKMFALIVKEHGIKNTEDARNCSELWDVSNGRVLCKKCHRKTNSYFKRL